MPRAGSGAYTLPAGNPVVTGTPIASTWANNTMSDLATEITASLDRSGRGAMLAALKVVDGAAATPGLVFAQEPTTGFFRASAGNVGFSILLNQILNIDATGLIIGAAARTGIGAASDPLAVKGHIGFGDGTATVAQLNGNSTTFLEIVNRATGGGVKIYTDAGGTAALAISSAGVMTDKDSNELGYKRLPRNTFWATPGQVSSLSAGFTVDVGDAAGLTYYVYNNSAAAITATQGSGLTLRLSGTTTTGSRTLAPRGFGMVWYNATNEAICVGDFT